MVRTGSGVHGSTVVSVVLLVALALVGFVALRTLRGDATSASGAADDPSATDTARPDAGDATADDAAATSGPANPSPSAEATDLQEVDPGPTGPVTLAFGGDVHFESWLRDAVRADPSNALDPVGRMLRGADLAMVNLETAVTERGQPSPKEYNFRAPTEGLDALQAAGVDVVSVANNHGMDFGAQGLADTLAAGKAAGLPMVGGGTNRANAYRPYRTTIKGRRIAVFGATQVLDSFAITAWNPGPGRPGLASAKEDLGGERRLLRGVRSAAADADTVVVMLHWGLEGQECPLDRQQVLAERLRDAGADVVVGGHAHRVSPGGFLGDTAIHYGLGNFVFYTADGPGTSSGVVKVTIQPDDRIRMVWRPAVLRGGVATALTGAERDQATASWKALRSCTRLSGSPGRTG